MIHSQTNTNVIKEKEKKL